LHAWYKAWVRADSNFKQGTLTLSGDPKLLSARISIKHTQTSRGKRQRRIKDNYCWILANGYINQILIRADAARGRYIFAYNSQAAMFFLRTGKVNTN